MKYILENIGIAAIVICIISILIGIDIFVIREAFLYAEPDIILILICVPLVIMINVFGIGSIVRMIKVIFD